MCRCNATDAGHFSHLFSLLLLLFLISFFFLVVVICSISDCTFIKSMAYKLTDKCYGFQYKASIMGATTNSHTHTHTHVYHNGTRKLELQVYPPVLILYITKNLHHNIFVKLKMEKLYEAHKLEENGGTMNKHQM